MEKLHFQLNENKRFREILYQIKSYLSFKPNYYENNNSNHPVLRVEH